MLLQNFQHLQPSFPLPNSPNLKQSENFFRQHDAELNKS